MAYIGNRPVVGRYATLDTLTFNGSNTNYTLTIGGQPTFPGSPQNLIISVAGVVQSPGDAYTINGSTIQFTGAPSNTASFWGVQLGDVYSVAVASNTGVASLRTSYTASNNQTTFTVTGGYVPGQIDVYRNGVKLVNGSDVNISSGNTFVLASGAANNDVIEVIGAQSVTAGGSSTLIKQTFTANSTVNSSFAVTNGYTPGMIDVYVNGVKQVNGQDVNVSSGSNVVFTSALANGSIVDVTGYQALSVYNGYVFRNGDTMTGTLTVPKLYANNGVTDTAGYISTQPTMRNKIINGDMRIDQRNAGASVTTTTDLQYLLDRWQARLSVTSKFSVQQNAGSVTPPAGYSNYLGITSLSAYSIAAGDYFAIQQRIEGFNTVDLAWGTASAASVTLSFWVRSSLTGIFGGGFSNSTGNRTYPFSYTISSANTWEQKSVTIAGDTTGTWVTNSGLGVQVNFGIGVSSTYSGTAGAWSSSTYLAPTGATSVVGTNGATFYITGVQLEKGSVATPFEYRNFQQELAMCQRYYCKTFDIGTAPGNDVTTAGALRGAAVTINASSQIEPAATWKFPVSMRATPTITMYAPGTSGHTAGQWTNDGNAGSSANARNNFTGTESASFDNTGTLLSAGFRSIIHATASAEL